MTGYESETIPGAAPPVFIVGMPRSGTKLLRGMLTQHPQIRFAQIETEFFPFWARHWQRFGAIDDREAFERFYRSCRKLPFFIQCSEKGIPIECDEWFARCAAFTPAGVFSALMRTAVSIPANDDSIAWGDKSPSYITHVPLLRRHFPDARILHIVRDARDYSLSVNKAWGKSMLRAAQRWQSDVSKCLEDGRRLPDGYMEIRYEDLLADPVAILSRTCRFLGVGFTEDLLELDPRTENKGDAQGMASVMTSNVRKYEARMSPRMVAKIERIACTTLRLLDYPCGYEGPPVPLPAWKQRFLQLKDGVSLVRSTASKRGWVGALRYRLRYYKVSGNRVR